MLFVNCLQSFKCNMYVAFVNSVYFFVCLLICCLFTAAYYWRIQLLNILNNIVSFNRILIL